MSKREHTRHIINHAATLILNDGVRIECYIQNYSRGGLFLTAPNKSALDLPHGSIAKVVVKTGTDSKQAPINTVHAHGGGVGVAFLSKEDELLQYLQTASTTPHSKYEQTSSSYKSDRMGTNEIAIVNWIHSTTKQFLKSRYAVFIKSAHDNLFDAADHSDNNQTQSMLYDAYNSLQQHQEEIEHQFLNNIDSSFIQFRNNNISDTGQIRETPQEPELELVAEEDFEEWVSVVSLTRNLEPELASKLHLVENSLSFLAKRYINDDKNPVSPYSLLWSLKKSFTNLDIPLQAKKSLFTSFHDNILKEVGSLLEEINLYLDMKGITKRAQAESTKEQPKTTTVQANAEIHSSSDARISQRLSNTLSSLLNFVSRKTAPDTIGNAGGQTASKEEVVHSLANISTVGQRSIINKIEEQLADITPDGRTGTIDSNTRQTIQVTEQILGSLQQDSQIDPQIHELIESLKIPLVK